MRSLEFPKMFNTNSSNVSKSSEYLKMIRQNLKLILGSIRKSLLGDPYFGIQWEQYRFDQNDPILIDKLIDEIYTQVALFSPSLKVERKGISINPLLQKGKLYISITGINQIDYTINTFDLVMLRDSEAIL